MRRRWKLMLAKHRCDGSSFSFVDERSLGGEYSALAFQRNHPHSNSFHRFRRAQKEWSEENSYNQRARANRKSMVTSPTSHSKTSSEQAVSPTTASAQFRAWVASEAGRNVWNNRNIAISIEGICNALDQTRAKIYGLLVSPEGTIIFSAIHQRAFTRLLLRYRAAAVAGVCFWWDGVTLRSMLDSEHFLAMVRTLPAFQDHKRCKH